MFLNIGIDKNGIPYVSIEKGGGNRILRKKGKSLLGFPKCFTVVDIETTGLSSEYSEIIEIAAIKYIDYKQVATFSKLVKPNEPIGEFITKLTGITNYMLSDASSISEVLPEFLAFLGEDIVIGHNVNFDINFIYDNCVLLELPLFSNDFVDTMRIAKRLIPGLENYKLNTVSNTLNIAHKNAHRALSDCEAAAACYLSMRTMALEQFGSIEEFIKQKTRNPIKSKDITTNVTDFDTEHPLYGKVCCFTGVLDNMLRKDAMQLVADFGGLCSDNVTKKTNYLILGNNDYCTTIKGGKSSKQKKAEEYKLKGYDIEIIPENVFYDMINEPILTKYTT